MTWTQNFLRKWYGTLLTVPSWLSSVLVYSRFLSDLITGFPNWSPAWPRFDRHAIYSSSRFWPRPMKCGYNVGPRSPHIPLKKDLWNPLGFRSQGGCTLWHSPPRRVDSRILSTARVSNELEIALWWAATFAAWVRGGWQATLQQPPSSREPGRL